MKKRRDYPRCKPGCKACRSARGRPAGLHGLHVHTCTCSLSPPGGFLPSSCNGRLRRLRAKQLRKQVGEAVGAAGGPRCSLL